MMHIHCHITLPIDVNPPKGWKKTTILYDGKKDVMVTRHAKINDPEALGNFVNECINLGNNINAIRVKVEADTPYINISKDHYIEIHAKVLEDHKIAEGWVKSRNPREMKGDTKVFFHNLRIRSMDELAKALSSIREYSDAIELKIEQLVYDSNIEHDANWA